MLVILSLVVGPAAVNVSVVPLGIVAVTGTDSKADELEGLQDCAPLMVQEVPMLSVTSEESVMVDVGVGVGVGTGATA